MSGMTGTTTVEWTEKEKQNWQAIETKQSFRLAFSGHFSAGKSTLLNELLGAPLLPTSPIPTSANQVIIGQGDIRVVLEKASGEEENWQGAIDWDAVKRSGMDGTQIKRLRIYAPIPFLKHGSELMDTPGVDSTDPTHQRVTLDALYTTDAIVFVMDYNHVKAETNLYFLKQLSTEGKPLFLVINQIDKHEEGELSFAAYRESIESTLKEWGIRYVTIYYTSMKKTGIPENELVRFKQEMKALLLAGNRLAEASKNRLKHSFYKSVQRRLQEEKDEAVHLLDEQAAAQGASFETLLSYQEEYERLERLKDAHQNRQSQFQGEWQSLFRQATLFNAALMEQTQQWLETLQPNFRVGWFFSKKKTEEERMRLLKQLTRALDDQIQSQLVFHVKRSLQTIPVDRLANKEAFLEAVECTAFHIDESFVSKHAPTETVGREYAYQFAKERTDEIIREVKKRANAALEKAQAGLRTADQAALEKGKAELEQHQRLKPLVEKWVQLNQAYANQVESLESAAKRVSDNGAFEQALQEARKQQLPEDEQQQTNWVKDIVFSDEALFAAEEQEKPTERLRFSHEPNKSALRTLLRQYQANIWGSEWRERLERRLKQMEEQQFTISLFGAFSAGKSSFANALLGADVLPTSPHPTTATVTRVQQATDSFSHGTVQIRYKGYQELEQEIASIGKLLSLTLTPETLTSFKLAGVKTETAAKKQARAYLQTLAASLKQREMLLSTTTTVPLTELSELVANEAHACLIADVCIYYDCLLTTQGLTLVDTPGVNSIHGRHTNVAYEQVRRSDAIFYVTYYNHSFSKTDARFIEQLGKINKQFTSNKLYFVLNAVDLAANQSEQKGVEAYVLRSMQSAGVENAALYPISSKIALAEKRAGKPVTGLFAAFENELYGRMLQTFKQLNVDILYEEVAAYNRYLQQMATYAKAGAGSQKQHKDEISESLAQMYNAFCREAGEPLKQRLQQEASELFLYLRERMQYMLRDGFGEHVNVATVQGTTKKAQRESLAKALREWGEDSSSFLAQEARATAVRLTLSFKRHYRRWLKEWEQAIQQAYEAFYLEEQETIPFAFQVEPPDIRFDTERYAKNFQSLKSLFEGGELDYVKEQAAAELAASAVAYVRDEEARCKEAVIQAVQTAFMAEKDRMESAIALQLQRLETVSSREFAQQMEQENTALQNWLEQETANQKAQL